MVGPDIAHFFLHFDFLYAILAPEMTDTTLNIAASGIRSAEAQYEALVNNIVNAHTFGYKTVGASLKSFPEFLSEIEEKQGVVSGQAGSVNDPQVVQIAQVYADYAQGPVAATNRNLDFAIEGEGFFSAQTAWGVAYTRDGRFNLNNDGLLVTSVGGYPVLGEKGPIMVPPGRKFEVMPNGQILVDGNLVDQIKITAFENPRVLELSGGSFFRLPVDKEAVLKTDARYQLRQGVLETSNVSVVDEMVKMIVLMKIHEGNINVAKARDTLLSKVVDMGGALRP